MSDDEDVEHDDGSEGEHANEIFVPWERLSPDALAGVIEEYVTREGTDYGHTEHSLDAKMAAVQKQLEKGEVVVLFDAVEQSVNLVPKRDVPAR